MALAGMEDSDVVETRRKKICAFKLYYILGLSQHHLAFVLNASSDANAVYYANCGLAAIAGGWDTPEASRYKSNRPNWWEKETRYLNAWTAYVELKIDNPSTMLQEFKLDRKEKEDERLIIVLEEVLGIREVQHARWIEFLQTHAGVPTPFKNYYELHQAFLKFVHLSQEQGEEEEEAAELKLAPVVQEVTASPSGRGLIKRLVVETVSRMLRRAADRFERR